MWHRDFPFRCPSISVQVNLCQKLLFLHQVKFIYSEMATKFCEIFTLLLTTVHTVKRKVKISQNFVAFSEHMNFTTQFGDKDFASQHLILPRLHFHEIFFYPETKKLMCEVLKIKMHLSKLFKLVVYQFSSYLTITCRVSFQVKRKT